MPWLLTLLCCLLLSLSHAEAATKAKPHKAVKPKLAALAVSQSLAWDTPTDPDKFILRRCQVTAPATTCTPTVDLPLTIAGNVRQIMDPTAPGGTTSCWTIQAVVGTQRSAASNKACQALGGILPAPGTIVITPVGMTLHLTWQAPVFNVSTVPASALTSYQVIRAQEPVVPGAWTSTGILPISSTTWDDAGPFPGVGRWCYWVRANYGPTDYADSAQSCAAAPVVVPVIPAPFNLRTSTP